MAMSYRVTIIEKEGPARVMELDTSEVTIGRVKGNDVVLPKGNISKRHARVVDKDGKLILVDLKSTNGTYVNGRKLSSPRVLRERDKIYIGDFTLTVEQRAGGVQPSPPPLPPASASRSEETSSSRRRVPTPTPRDAEEIAELIAPREDYAAEEGEVDARAHEIEVALAHDETRAVQAQIFSALTRAGELDQLAVDPAAAELAVRQILDEISARGALPAGFDDAAAVAGVITELCGFGPLEELLRDDSVSQIFASGPHSIHVERARRGAPHKVTFSCAASMRHVIQRLLRASHIDVDGAAIVDARLAGGAHLSALLPPVCAGGPAFTLRKPAPSATLEQLVEEGVLSGRMAAFLRTCVRARRNILVSASDAREGTRLLRAIADLIESDQRIVTVEEVAQLNLRQPNVTRLEASPAARRGGVGLRELVRAAQRLAPDRLIVGDCCGGEAREVLRALAGAVDGGMLLVRGDSARDGVGRLEAMVAMGGVELTALAVREAISSTIDVVVQVSRCTDGVSRATQIAAVSGVEVDLVTLQELFVFRAQGVGSDGAHRGRFLATGAVPRFYDELQRSGEELDLGVFREGS